MDPDYHAGWDPGAETLGGDLEPERKDEEPGGSLVGEVSIVTLIVSVVIVLAIAGYALLLIVEMFR